MVMTRDFLCLAAWKHYGEQTVLAQDKHERCVKFLKSIWFLQSWAISWGTSFVAGESGLVKRGNIHKSMLRGLVRSVIPLFCLSKRCMEKKLNSRAQTTDSRRRGLGRETIFCLDWPGWGWKQKLISQQLTVADLVEVLQLGLWHIH